MQLELFHQLAAYNRWMNERLFRVAARLSDEDRRRDLGAFFGSVHLTLTHLLITDRAWLARLTRNPDEFRFVGHDGQEIPVTGGVQDVYPNFEDLGKARAATDTRIIEVTSFLDFRSLDETIRYRDSAGALCEHPLWWAISHLFNHQTHHRGQVTTLLSQLGHDPGVTDFLMFLRGAA